MADAQISNAQISDALPAEDEGPVLPRHRVEDTADLDITPMIDIVFLLLIFFLVAAIPGENDPELPPARFGTGVNPRTAVVFTIAEQEGNLPARVYLGDGKAGDRIPTDPAGQRKAITAVLGSEGGQGGVLLPDDLDVQDEIIRMAVEEGFQRRGKGTVLLKAEKRVRHHEVARVATAVGMADVEGVTMHFAVLEIK